MARTAKLKIRRLDSGKWYYDLPPALSPTGARSRRTFDTKTAAEVARAGELDRHRLYGVEGHAIPASLAADAEKAFSLIEGHGVTLTAVCKEWLERKKAQSASCTIAALWGEYLTMKSGSGISSAYERDLVRFGTAICEELGKAIVCDLDPGQLEKAILKHFQSNRQFANACRTIRPAFSFAVRRGYCQQNPFDRIEPRRLPPPEISVLTIKQVRGMFAACRDHRAAQAMPESYRQDCSDCAAAVALLLFAGIRPRELPRLTWDDVHFDHGVIKVGHAAAKTRSTRFIPIEDNLRSWLETVPPEERKGAIVPASWGRKQKAIRHAAGVGHLQDAARHSFASYHLAANNDFPGLQQAMGHGTPEMILKHYRTLVTKADAVKFWQILPAGTKATTIRAVS